MKMNDFLNDNFMILKTMYDNQVRHILKNIALLKDIMN